MKNSLQILLLFILLSQLSVAVAVSCESPSIIRWNSKTSVLSWSGQAAWYDVRQQCVTEGSTIEYNGLTANSCICSIYDEGIYQFDVRAYCDSSNFSDWVSVTRYCWLPGSRCYDYLDFGESQVHNGVCYKGNYDAFMRYKRQGTIGMVDNGPTNMNSMHTVHTDVNEIDPNTTVDDGLKTIPDGEHASVRLGAYSRSGQSARIEYTYPVQAGVSDLLTIKYAVVMQSGGHQTDINGCCDMTPTFSVNILDENGVEIDSCWQLLLIGGVTEGHKWHVETNNRDLYWCDWKTLTVPLQAYVGQSIIIRFTAARCSYDTHPAYGYFTIGCSAGFEGYMCTNAYVDHFEAPEGFAYRWYVQSNSTHEVVSTNRVLELDDDDDQIYLLEYYNPSNEACSQTVIANPNPHQPEAVVEVRVQADDYENNVSFINHSLLHLISRADASIMSSTPITSVMYDYGDNSEYEWVTDSVVVHKYPKTGGTFHFAAIASMSDLDCSDTIDFDITLPNIQEMEDTMHIPGLSGDTIPLYFSLCDNQAGRMMYPVDPKQVVVVLQENRLTICEHLGAEVTYAIKPNTTEIVNELTGSFRRFVTVQLNEYGTYSLKLTSPDWNDCMVATFNYSEPIDAVEATSDALAVCTKKVLRDGHIVIEHNNKIFTLTGIQVK